MNQSSKRILSTIAIVIASVAFGVLISADLGMMQKSHAQSASAIQTSSGPVTSVTIPSFADVASRVMPAVVSITTTEIVHQSALRQRGMTVDPFDFFFPNPNGQRNPNNRRQTPDNNGNGNGNGNDDERRQLSGGSGFIISPDGYIMTNNHVVEDAAKVEVHYGADENGNGGHTVTAKIIGRDPETDIALLKIDSPTPLPSISLGDSDRIRKGDWAIAVGNPFQFENTLTVGVISAKGRSLNLSEQTRSFENFIQTDAAINFGNSGGPLLNINGEVVGINTAIRAGGAVGLGFATPINTAKRLLPQLKQGKVVRGYLGMQITDVTENTARALNLPEARGAEVETTEAGAPAEKAGIQHGDIIVDVDGKAIRNNRELIDYISYLPVGSTVKVGIIRNGQHMTLAAKTATRPPDGTEETENTPNVNEPSRNRLGLSVSDISADMRTQYGLGDNVSGVVVTSVKDVSPAGEVGISEGDVISEVQGTKITSAAQFRGVVDSLKPGEWIRVYVSTPTRNGKPVSSYRTMQVPK
ncbi:MAG TPA: Do family serine endopeptidase [Thermoanaerobaculia bacterium]|jgi:serine protease Do|nr:Do family serine endopeptidase [Thermoanaerobaculia bacterium]